MFVDLNIVKLGIFEYAEALSIQEKAHALRLENKINDTFLLLEHHPVITLGRRGKKENILISEKILLEKKIAIYEANRGGDVTYHGPGQLVGYLFFNLKNHPGGIKKFVWNIQEVFIRLLKEYGITSERNDKTFTGVWVGNDKITAVGIYVAHWVTMHGFSFNVNTDLSHFGFINPCGILGKGVTSLEKLLGAKTDFNEICGKVAELFADVFGMNKIEVNENDFLSLLKYLKNN